MAAKSMQSLQTKEKTMKEEIEKFRDLQKDIRKCITSRSQLDSQLNENTSVKEELDILEDDAVVYKLIGPVLVKQELGEAKATVAKRIDYITKEMDRYDRLIEEHKETQDAGAMKLKKLQEDYQQELSKASAAAAAMR